MRKNTTTKAQQTFPFVESESGGGVGVNVNEGGCEKGWASHMVNNVHKQMKFFVSTHTHTHV